ncbi:MAG: EamA family transporter [Bacteroidota bacterium]
MTWIAFALLTAFFRSLTDVAGKKSMHQLSPYTVAWSMYIFSLPLLAAALFFVPVPEIGEQFWLALIAGSLLNTLANILYMNAIKLSDLSLTVPLVTFTPLFMLLTSPIIVGEFPSLWGIVGIVLIVGGSYSLNLKARSQGFLAPFRALLREKGARLMLLVAFIWSLSSNFDKMGILNSSALYWAFLVNVGITIGITPIVLLKEKKLAQQLRDNKGNLSLVGLFNGATILFQMIAVSLTLVAYVIAIKRSSAVISVVFGKIFFGEKGLKQRLIGALIMLLGVVAIMLSSLK